MKFPLNWLKEFVDIQIPAQELADKLSLSGFEVEAIIPIGQDLCHIVTGRIDKIEPHPNADRLRITQVFDGTQTHQIVTAAQNIFEHAIVPVSLPGAILANGLKIKNGILRGVESNGMLCSQVELGMADVSEGIWILPSDTALGLDMVEYALLKDYLFDISILPNRGDCQSILGLAREISALLNTPLKIPESKLNLCDWHRHLTIDIQATESCPLYTARVLGHVQSAVSAAPIWMSRRLQLAGFRPINPIVDVTNYVMLECGQPLHAFDERAIANPLVVRYAKEKETLTTLDGSLAKLSENHLVIADAHSPIAIPGVVGGIESGVQDSTQTIVIESAYFDPISIRKTRTSLGYRTESAIRFEKGVDPEKVRWASDRAAYLLQTVMGASVGPLQGVETPGFLSTQVIPWAPEKINAMLGSSYTETEMLAVLSRLGFEYSYSEQSIKVPSWRVLDVKELPCLAEEIARILGFNTIPTTLPDQAVSLEKDSALVAIRKKLQATLIAKGFNQVNTFPMVSEFDFQKTGIALTEKTFKLSNPLTPEAAVMRHQLLPSLLNVLMFNHNRGEKNLSFFEIGKVYIDNKVESEEPWYLGVMISGALAKNIYFSQDKAQNYLTFYTLKGLAESLLESLSMSQIEIKPTQSLQWNPGQSMEIWIRGIKIGEAGLLHPKQTLAYDCDAPVGMIDLNLSLLSELQNEAPVFKAIPKFPSIRRDVSLLAPKSLAYQDILTVIEIAKVPLLKNVYLFDYYESDSIGADKKSLALGLIYQDEQKTLTDEDIQPVHLDLCQRLQASLPLSIR